MRNRQIALLGGGGFIGRALTTVMINQGYKVHWIDSAMEITRSRLPEGVMLHHGELGDENLLKYVLRDCTAVFHVASGTIPITSYKNPTIESEANIAPTLRLIEAIQNYSKAHLFFVSSGGAVYGNPYNVPVKETEECAPLSYYGSGKVAIESFFTTLGRIYDRRVTIIRPPNLYGPSQPLRPGFGLIRTMLESLIANQAIEIYGDGEAVRDYCFIDDLTNACRLLLQYGMGGVYNVGSGKGYSINHIRSIIENISGNKIKVRYKPQRATDVDVIILDSTKLSEKTGWKAEIDIGCGIQRTWNWLTNENERD